MIQTTANLGNEQPPTGSRINPDAEYMGVKAVFNPPVFTGVSDFGPGKAPPVKHRPTKKKKMGPRYY